MDPLRLDAAAARVVAWHNRHPLARRINAAHVLSVGYVALPFVRRGVAVAAAPAAALADSMSTQAAAAPEGGSLRERAMARARQHEGAPGSTAPPAASTAALPVGPERSDGKLEAAFNEDFIEPINPRQVARWAARQGLELALAPTDAPVRLVRRENSVAGAAPVTLYLLTAAVEIGSARTRVLLGAGAAAPVLGRRLRAWPRVWAATAMATAAVGLLAVVVALALRPDAPDSAALASVETAASAARAAPAASAADEPNAPSAEAPASAAVPAASPVLAASPAAADVVAARGTATAEAVLPQASAPGSSLALPPVVAAVAPAESTATAASASAQPWAPRAPAARPVAAELTSPLDVGPHLGLIERPNLKPRLSAEAKLTARQAGQAAREHALATPSPAARPGPAASGQAASAHTPAATPAVASTVVAGNPVSAAGASAASVAAMPAPAAAASPVGPASFAVSTRPLRTRAEAEQVAAAMGALLSGPAHGNVTVEILPQGEDWRVVGWPYPRHDDAEKARALLASRGMRAAVVVF